ncbi:MAG TPA: exodeoxyribonuclease VII large subunit [Casimicrobiaceae bacterium]|jgi:exodeoxyribonuclease VII large subunit
MNDAPLDPRAPLSVSALVAAARLALERDLGVVQVAGEISGFTRAASGHCYFSLKDAAAQVRCVMWRTRARVVDFTLADGLAVEVRAVASIYEPRGEFQLAVDSIRAAGSGALFERFARLKAKLEAAGWFDAARKRPLPAYARAVGIVTSTRAAALRDVVITLRRRWPAMRVVVYPCAVQGAGAAAEIAAAIAAANARAEVEVLIVCRGGGSIEDLWAFNEEAVARAIVESRLPVVSGVGHETDFTIADFVADVRAPTPTGAAALVAPDRAAERHRVAQWMARIVRGVRHVLATRVQRADIAARGLVHPRARLAAQADSLRLLAGRAALAWRREAAARDAAVAATALRLRREMRTPLPEASQVARLAERWRRAAALDMARAGTRVDTLAQNLAHLSPRHVLARGYAIVARKNGGIAGDVVQDARALAPGEDIEITFARGRAGARVTGVERD